MATPKDGKALKVLLLEDRQADAELILHALRSAGYMADAVRVDTEADYLAHLDPAPDLILADYNLPQFDGFRALRAARQRGMDTPFFLISGSIGEEVAVEAIQLGADDYLLKDRLARLGAAVQRAFEKRALAAGKKTADEALRESEDRFRRMAENAQDIIFRYRLDGARGMEYISPAVTAITGFTPEEHYADPDLGYRYVHPEDRPLLEAINRGESPSDQTVNLRWIHKDGKVIWTEQRTIVVRDEQGRPLATEGIARDVTQRKQAEDRLRLSSEILQRVASLVIVADGKGEVTYVSPSVETILGFDTSEVLGEGWWELSRFDGSEKESERQRVAAAARGERPIPEEPYERPVRTRDGEIRWIEWQDAKGPGDLVIGVGHDVTERKLSEVERARMLEETRQRAVRLSALNAVIRASTQSVSDPRQLLEGALERTLEALGVEMGSVWTADGPTASLGLPPEAIVALSEAAREADLKVTTVQATEDWRAVSVDHPSFRLAAKMDHWGIRASLALPLALDDQMMGRMSLHTAQPHAWSAEEIDLAEAIGRELAAAFGRARLIQLQAQRATELDALAQVSLSLRSAGTRAEMLPLILDKILDLLPVQGVAFAFYYPEMHETIIELGRGKWQGATGKKYPLGGRFGTWTTEPFLHPDVRQDEDFGPMEDLNGLFALASIPLIAQGQTFGAIWAGRTPAAGQPTGEVFPASELRLLTAIADIAASAIRRAALHEQTEQRLRRSAALRTVDMAITGSLDLRLTLEVLLDQLASQLDVDSAAVLALNPHTQALEFVAGQGFRTRRIEKIRLRMGESFAGQVAMERRMIAIPELSEDDKAKLQTLAGEGFAAYVAVPLVAKGHVNGVLEIFHREPLRVRKEWVDFLEALASQAAIAIDNATLFTNLQRSNLELALAYDTTLEGWSRALDLRDKETEGHTQRVAEMTQRLAHSLGVSEGELVHIRRGALLHDIGKMGIPDSILLKPGALTDPEWEIMRRHPGLAYEMLSPIEYLRPALDIPYCHHEKWDGTGYPRGLRGEQIPLAARIFAVADVYDALRSDRPYRKARPEVEVLEFIRGQAGIHFDPKAVEVFQDLRAMAADGRGG